MANRKPKRTTLKQSSDRGFKRRGRSAFTLIEILIVLTIISMVMAVSMPAISRVTYQRVNSTTRRFVGLMRTIRNDAILLNTIYRLAIDLEKKVYWVESQRQFKLLGQEESELVKKKKKLKKGEGVPSNFILAQKFFKEPVPFPGGVAINGVLKDGTGLVKEGIAYVHFFPNGFNEQAIVYINREGATEGGYSLWLHSNLGKIDVVRYQLTSFELKAK